MEEKVKQYAYVMMFLSLAFSLLNVSGVIPVHSDPIGFGLTRDMAEDVNEIQEKFTSSSGFEYVIAVGLLIYNGVKIVLTFVVIVFTGVASVAQFFSIPYQIYIPIQMVIDAIVMYDLGKMLLRIG